MTIRGWEDVRTTATRGLGGAPQAGWYPGTGFGIQNGSVTRDAIYVSPLPTGTNSVRITDLQTTHGSPANSMSLRFAVFDSRSDGWPNTLLFDSGPILSAGNTLRTVTTSLPLAPETLYYMASIQSSTTIFMHVPEIISPAFGWEPDLGAAYGVLTASWAFGAFPATFPTSGVPVSTGPTFSVILR